MRTLRCCVAFLFLAAAVGAQTLDPATVSAKRFDDGSAENSWKVTLPTSSNDFFNLDLNNSCAGETVVGISVDTTVTIPGAADGRVGLYPDDLAVDPSGTTPDLAMPITELVAPTGGNISGSCPSTVVFDTPDVTLNTSVHVGYIQATGDTSLWLCADATNPNGNSYFTSTAYASPAIPFTLNWMMGLAGEISPGSLFVNGGTDVCVLETETIVIDFVSGCPQSGLIGLMCVAVPGFPPLYFPVVIADSQGNWKVTVPLGCGFRPSYPLVLCLQVLYLDFCGGNAIKSSNTVKLTLKEDVACNAGKVCFGTRDDGILDTTIWKVNNPSSSGDWFNVRHGGVEGTSTSTITGVEIASWDFCGSTQSWASVGVFTASSMDPSAGTPDLTSPVTVVGGASATIPGGQSDWAFPATMYDVPDVALTTTTYHVAANWVPGDTCVWLGSDTTGTSDDGGTLDCSAIPSSTSFFTADSYATNAIPFSTANWMMRINWN